MLILTFKCIKYWCPNYLCNQFSFVHDSHDHLTRSHTSNTLNVSKCNSNSGKRTFGVRAATLWNNLPASLSNAIAMPCFDNASSVWSNCSMTNQYHLQVLHNRLARTILSADIRTPIDDMLTSLNWIRLCNR